MVKKKEPIRGEYSKYINETRRAVPTPKSMVRADGSCEFGTFDKEFEEGDCAVLDLQKSVYLTYDYEVVKLYD